VTAPAVEVARAASSVRVVEAPRPAASAARAGVGTGAGGR
jgi:hypothetical protein